MAGKAWPYFATILFPFRFGLLYLTWQFAKVFACSLPPNQTIHITQPTDARELLIHHFHSERQKWNIHILF